LISATEESEEENLFRITYSRGSDFCQRKQKKITKKIAKRTFFRQLRLLGEQFLPIRFAEFLFNNRWPDGYDACLVFPVGCAKVPCLSLRLFMQLQPKPLILKLLLAADGQQLSARDAIRAGALFGIADNHMRVALTRLTAEGLIEAAARGQYQLTLRAWTLAGEIRGWRESVALLQSWNGNWLAVHCAGLGRSDRKQLAVRERALALCGCAELERELYLRPDNLAGGSEALRARLYKLGEEQMVFQLSGLDSDRQQRAVALWDCAALNARYQQQALLLQEWLQRVPQLSLEQAAREAFLLGDEAIRQMVFDPLLPAELIDADARAAYLNVLLEYDRVGHDIWHALYQQSNGSHV